MAGQGPVQPLLMAVVGDPCRPFPGSARTLSEGRQDAGLLSQRGRFGADRKIPRSLNVHNAGQGSDELSVIRMHRAGSGLMSDFYCLLPLGVASRHQFAGPARGLSECTQKFRLGLPKAFTPSGVEAKTFARNIPLEAMLSLVSLVYVISFPLF